MITPDIVFLLLSGIALTGFVLDALFHRLRITSVLPLMLVGVILTQSRAVPPVALALLRTLIPYVSALTIAFILFSVGLEIRFAQLSQVFRRATLFTIAVQVSSGLALSALATYLFGWNVLLGLTFGFALSGPSSIAVPTLVRATGMGESLGTTLLFESVLTDVLQLVLPLTLLTLYVSGHFSTVTLASSLVWLLLGSSAAGLAAGVFWLWILHRLREVARGYTWTLTISMVLATYAIADEMHLSAAITTFVFGLTIGNAIVIDFAKAWQQKRPWTTTSRLVAGTLRILRISPDALDVPRIQQVHKEVAFFASTFFFVYIGLLFEAPNLSFLVVVVPILAALFMVVPRLAALPVLEPYLAKDARARRSERALIAFDVPRGLASTVIATVPAALGLTIPGFLDAMFFAVLFSNVVSTAGVFLFYRGRPVSPVPRPTAADRTNPSVLAPSAPFAAFGRPPEPDTPPLASASARRGPPPLPATSGGVPPRT
jgi:NhaP-type Na+/H+ or K+/H+ antiporter